MLFLPVRNDICLIQPTGVVWRYKVIGRGDALAIHFLTGFQRAVLIACRCALHVLCIFVTIEQFTRDADPVSAVDVLMELYQNVLLIEIRRIFIGSGCTIAANRSFVFGLMALFISALNQQPSVIETARDGGVVAPASVATVVCALRHRAVIFPSINDIFWIERLQFNDTPQRTRTEAAGIRALGDIDG